MTTLANEKGTKSMAEPTNDEVLKLLLENEADYETNGLRSDVATLNEMMEAQPEPTVLTKEQAERERRRAQKKAMGQAWVRQNWNTLPPDIQDYVEGTDRRVKAILEGKAPNAALKEPTINLPKSPLKVVGDVQGAVKPALMMPTEPTTAKKAEASPRVFHATGSDPATAGSEQWWDSETETPNTAWLKEAYGWELHESYGKTKEVCGQLAAIAERDHAKNYRTLIAVPSNADNLNKGFVRSLEAMEKPAGTLVKYLYAYSVAEMRNKMALEVIKEECTHLLMLDSDMVYPEETLTRLLSHELDIVSGFSCRRLYPHEFIYPSTPSDDPEEPYVVGVPKDSTKIPVEGVQKVASVGGAGTLIRTKVFAAMEYPYFSLEQHSKNGKRIGEDVFFCVNAARLGFEAWMDMELAYGHIVPMVVTPAVRLPQRVWDQKFTALEF